MNNKWYTSVKQIGNNIYVRGYDNGEHYKDKVEYYPTFFVRSKTPTEYKTLHNQYVAPVNPGTIKESRQWLEQYREVEGFDVYGNENSIYQYISDAYPAEIEFDINKIKLVTIDIETTADNGVDVESANEQIVLITLQHYSTKKTLTWGINPFPFKVENNTYFECKDEADLLRKFLDYWESDYPEVVTGYNVRTFDIPYIVKRCQKVLGESEAKRLSIWKAIREKRITTSNGKEDLTYDLYGIATLDFLELYKKYSFKNPENYRLDTVAENELGEKKLDHTEYDTFNEFQQKNWELFTKYNIQDVNLVDKLESKLKLIEMAMALAYQSKTNYEDVFHQVTMWDAIIYNYLKKRNIVIPRKRISDKDHKFEGAYVKEPIPSKYGYTVSLDATSLYPHIIMGVNISPETIVNEHFSGIDVDSILDQKVDTSKYPNYSIAPNGAMYRKDVKGFLPEIIEEMFEKRKQFKQLMLAAQQENEINPSEDLKKKIAGYRVKEQGLKACLNSAYGASGSPYFRFYDLRNAEAVTSWGRLAIRWASDKLNDYLNNALQTTDVDYVTYIDTDSLFLNVQPLVDKLFEGKDPKKEQVVNFLDKLFATKVQNYLNRVYDELAEYMHSYSQKLHMKREKIADSFVILAKKKYFINVWDNESVRYHAPKLAITGLEAIKSSTPKFCKIKIKEAFNLFVNGTEQELVNFIEQTKKEFYALPPEDVSFPRGISDLIKYQDHKNIYKKDVSVPMNARASLLYNHHVNKKGLTNKYPLIRNGDKIKYCYLKLPNPIKENVIGFVQRFPKELGLDKYVDYGVQFDKTFLQPLRPILDIIGWSEKETNTLDNFFL
jgi:DNA polymerase elongation subunit (family B)